jgi:beta-N-acetylhexosaminidase
MNGRQVVGSITALAVIGGAVYVGDHGNHHESTGSPVPQATDGGRPIWLHDSDPDNRCLANWPVDKLVGQLVVAGIPGNDLASYETAFADEAIGGALLMTQPADVNDGSILKFKTSGSVPYLISTDEEGGTVMRFHFPDTLTHKIPAFPAEQDAARRYSLSHIKNIVALYAHKQAAIGIDQDYGPVADRAQGANPLGSRTFSSNEATVARYSVVYAKALIGAGIIPTFKHAPGALSANSDVTMSTSPPLAVLLKHDFEPYYDLEKLSESTHQEVAIMAGTTKIKNMKNQLPADMNREFITGELREKLDFNASNDLIVTDDLGSKSIADMGISVPQAVEMAINAGADEAVVVVQKNGNLGTPAAVRSQFRLILGQLVAAVDHKRINIEQVDTSVMRVLAAKGVNPCN